MSNAPPCAACGWTLRWIPESHGWGCDRCRQFYPAQPQPQAQQPQQPAGHGYGHGALGQPALRTGGASKIGLWVAIGMLVIAGGVVGLVFALRGGGGGASTPEEVIKATLAAEAAGDVDALVKLADPEAAFARGMECKGEAARDEGIDPKQQAKKLREKMTELVKTTKGLKIELVESKSEEGGRADSVEKGKELAPGCTAKATLRFVSYKLKLKVTAADGKSGEQERKLNILDVDGSYFLLNPPYVKPPGKDASASIVAMTEFKDKMCACKDKACAQKVSDEFTAWSQKMAKETTSGEPDTLDPEAAKKMSEVATVFGECMGKAMQPPPEIAAPPPPPPPPQKIELAEAPSDIPSACKEYRDQVVKLEGCKDFTAGDIQTRAWNAMAESWPRMKDSSSTRRSFRKLCEQNASDLKKLYASLCR